MKVALDAILYRKNMSYFKAKSPLTTIIILQISFLFSLADGDATKEIYFW